MHGNTETQGMRKYGPPFNTGSHPLACWDWQDEGDLIESSSVGESHRHALPEPDLSLSAYQTLSTDEGFQG
jgi:hypothetical protein